LYRGCAAVGFSFRETVARLQQGVGVLLAEQSNQARWKMAITAGGPKRGAVSEINVVPLIDILLVLLIIFMVITPHKQTGLDAVLPQHADGPIIPQPEVVVVQVLADGTLRINQETVKPENLQSRLEEVFKFRADHTAFVRGDSPVEFSVVATVLDKMRAAGIAPIGLMTPELDKGR
jgi:biopolymer transport protein ExbD/biopolymer transport protein TolR